LALARRCGIVTIVPAGNSGSRVGCPADDANVLTVGGYREHVPRAPCCDVVADESNRGPGRDGAAKPDVVECRRIFAVRGGAPGTATDYDAGFGGTSAAAAVLAGRVATWFEANPRLSADAMREIVLSKARHLVTGAVSPNDQGHGAVDPE